MIQAHRVPFMLLAILSLLAGIVAGLQRIGWHIPVTGIASSHGAIMIGGFIGTLISLEKIIPLKNKVFFIIPALSGASVILFFIGFKEYALILLAAASAGLSVVFIVYLIKDRSVIYAIMFVGALCWLIGNILLITKGIYPLCLPWWIAFVLFIITSERLELMKFLPVGRSQKLFFTVILFVLLVSCFLPIHGVGGIVAGFSLIATSAWLMRHDVVSIGIRKKELTQYVSISLLAGYFALIVSGVFLFVITSHPLGYDIMVHTFFIGFVFSMIFAHGPIILPGVMGISLKPYHRIFYLWLILLHLSWILRAVADQLLNMEVRMYSGLLTTGVVLGYFISLVTVAIRSYRGKTI